MVIIYSPESSTRWVYILDEIFHRRLGVPFKHTQSQQEYLESEAKIKINYSLLDIQGIKILPSGLLFNTQIDLQLKPAYFGEKERTRFFPTGGELGYDIFSMAFWCLSRYEEYQPFEADKHGRFDIQHSYLNTLECAEFPILDMALNQFFALCGLEVADKFQIYPTVDVDIAFKYKGRSVFRWLGGLIQSILMGKTDLVMERISVLFGEKDPYDTFDYLFEALTKHKERVRFFIQTGSKGKYDKPVSIENKDYKRGLKSLATAFDLGIHPGYKDGETTSGITKQLNILEKFTGKKILRSRQHFLKMKLPETYNHLIEAGIEHDYTMGFSAGVGFRAGTAHSFMFYNLKDELATSLVVHPFCAMDVSLKNYLKLDAIVAQRKLEALKSVCNTEKAPFCFIFHNESVSDNGEWLGWRKVFEACLK